MEKLIKDGKVAVLYSPGYGAGWYSWNTQYEGLLFDPEIVQVVLSGDQNLAAEIAERKYEGCYAGGAGSLEVAWLDQGVEFEIHEYDGCESINVIGHRKYLTA